MTKDPVCHSEIDELDAEPAGLLSDYLGNVYHFCSSQCKKRFDRKPAAYAGHFDEWEEWDLPDAMWPGE